MQYVDSFISIAIGLYAVLLGCGVKLFPSHLRKKKWTIILGVLITVGGLANIASVPKSASVTNLAESVVEGIKKKISIPYQVDELTDLIDIKTDALRVIYVMKIRKDSGEAEVIIKKIQPILMQTACTNQNYRTLLAAGLTVEVRYTDNAYKEYAPAIVEPKLCGF